MEVFGVTIPLWALFLIIIGVIVIAWKLIKFAIKVLIIIVVFFALLIGLDIIGVFDWISEIIAIFL
jgi:hypothetical protein